MGNLIVRTSTFALGLIAATTITVSVAIAQNTPEDGQHKTGAPDRDIALGYSAGLTRSTTGNEIKESDGMPSSGFLVSLHNSKKFWIGYTANYGFAADNQSYTTANPLLSLFAQNIHQNIPSFANTSSNAIEMTGAYLIKGPILWHGIRPFTSLGTGALIFSPTSSRTPLYLTMGVLHENAAGDTHKNDIEQFFRGYATTNGQVRVPALIDAGIDIPLVRNRIGGRAEYRDRIYNQPDFGAKPLSTGNVLSSQQVVLSMFIKF